MTQVYSFDENAINEEVIATVANGLKKGQIAAFPTETVYGIGALDSCDEAVARIYSLKGRDTSKPLALYINKIESVQDISKQLPSFFTALVESFWPGPLTLIVKDKEGVLQGIRFSDNITVSKLLSLVPGLIRGTSANMSGLASPTTAQEVYAQFKNQIDFILDTGKCKYGVESTVLNIAQTPCVFLRRGVGFIDVSQFFKAHNIPYIIRKKILIVCTGNTCRSPMVKGWLMHLLKEKGLAAEFDIDSCGVYAPFSLGPSKDAIRVMKKENIDITFHRSKSISKKLAEEADKIIVMTQEHNKIITDYVPDKGSKVLILDIPDPIGYGPTFYEKIFLIIKDKINENFDWIVAS